MTQPSNNRPLLTFALVSCNQEPFVREAVEAALAQSYSPLEVILSDDCSDDRSFAIMEELLGQLYLVTVVALLVGRFGQRRREAA